MFAYKVGEMNLKKSIIKTTIFMFIEFHLADYSN